MNGTPTDPINARRYLGALAFEMRDAMVAAGIATPEQGTAFIAYLGDRYEAAAQRGNGVVPSWDAAP